MGAASPVAMETLLCLGRCHRSLYPAAGSAGVMKDETFDPEGPKMAATAVIRQVHDGKCRKFAHQNNSQGAEALLLQRPLSLFSSSTGAWG